MYKPHGGKLIDRTIDNAKREAASKEAEKFFKIAMNNEQISDIVNIAKGVFSPLEGFLNENDYLGVINNMRLSSNVPWTIPIVLDVNAEQVAKINELDNIALTYSGTITATMKIEDIYSFEKTEMSEKVFGTADKQHPGVAKVYNMKEYLIGGKITLISEPNMPFGEYILTPFETRSLFNENGWNTVVGFQTRNVPHIGHEYLQKTALSLVDGVFINPVIGKKKAGDFRDEVILETYDTLLENYFPKDRAVMTIFQTEMRYAGPKEAIFHAIVRKNFGCTHFIVGRDHAGVGDYYSPFAAHEIFNQFDDLEIEPILFKSFFFCRKCDGVSNDKTCPHPESEYINFSGTNIRSILENGEVPSNKLMRPEVADVILKYEKPFVE